MTLFFRVRVFLEKKKTVSPRSTWLVYINGFGVLTRQGQGPSTVFFYSAYLGPGPFIWPMAWGLHGFFYLSGPCIYLECVRFTWGSLRPYWSLLIPLTGSMDWTGGTPFHMHAPETSMQVTNAI